jgi:hypothetical protein
MATSEGTRRDLNRAIAVAAGLGLPRREADSIAIDFAAGECALALDTLCTQIVEYDLEVSPADRAHLRHLGAELGVPADYLLGDPSARKPEGYRTP